MEKDIEFLEKVSELFIQNGAKTVTMDDIAQELKISKKTLYQKYQNKEALLEEVLTYKLEKVIAKMRNLDETIENAVERMYSRDQDIEKASRTNDSVMLRQLIKYYPQIFNKHMLFFSEKLSEILAHNIERGRKQGLYREDFDAYFYSKLFFQLTMTYDNSPFLDTTNISREQYQHETLNFYMNAITTEEGKEVMKEFKPSYH
ncbi:TetR/AcrR family transcriptional regulator [Salinimicrobium sp. MT39]|uniref:TetR/AcrR family transcriptional regulator n=1 Tax=Salinimicrobium profundisediminis TaxID=2994553 RepID=A0A9X3CUM3_9FLAO|nr:TetR/AcrR family transcriptional regulator [Salinimicrobium profundisediminis]MCX2836984.1 TetR/AcrR family transcriptional regulator [Salinimicrobium profundisediminis]